MAKGVLLKVPKEPRGKRDGYIGLNDLTDKKPRGILPSWFYNDDVVQASQIPLNFRVTRKGGVIDRVTATKPFSIDIAAKVASVIHNKKLEDQFLERLRDRVRSVALPPLSCTYDEHNGPIICRGRKDIEFIIQTYCMPGGDSLTPAEEAAEGAYRNIGPVAGQILERGADLFGMTSAQREAGVRRVLKELRSAFLQCKLEDKELTFECDIPWANAFNHGTVVFVTGRKGRYEVQFELSGDASHPTLKAYRALDKKNCSAELSLDKASILIPLHKLGENLFFAYVPQLEQLYGVECAKIISDAIGARMLEGKDLKHSLPAGQNVDIKARTSVHCDIKVRMGEFILFRSASPEKQQELFGHANDTIESMCLHISINQPWRTFCAPVDGRIFEEFSSFIRQFKPAH